MASLKTVNCLLVAFVFGTNHWELKAQEPTNTPYTSWTASVNSTQKPGLPPDLAYKGLLATKEEFLSQEKLVERDIELEKAMAKGENPQVPSDFVSSQKSRKKLRSLALSLRNRVKQLRHTLDSDRASSLTPEARSEMIKATDDVLSMKLLNDVLPANEVY